MSRLLFALIAITLSAIAVAETDNYWSRKAQGWFWYVDPPVPAEEKEKDEAPPKVAMPQEAPAMPADPLEQLKTIQEMIARAEAKAVLYPTEENITEYLRLNQWQLNQASVFSDVWRRTVWQDPSLDYSLKRPTNAAALGQFRTERKDDKAAAVAEIAKTHGLFFFFKGSCPYCHTFAPTLRQFSEMYGMEVLPVSLDGGTLPEYPSPRVDSRVAAELGVEVVPSVYLVDPKQRNVIPVSHGVISVEALVDRIYVLTQTEPGKDY